MAVLLSRCRKRAGDRYRFGETEKPYLAGAGTGWRGTCLRREIHYRWFLRWTRIAAVLLLLLGIVDGIGSWKEHSAPMSSCKPTDYGKGSKGRFTLPDGSVVWLNSETKLTYPNQFADDRRLVSLEGEAYFEVAKDAKKPFVVQAGEIDVEVLGTCFDLDSYSSGEFVKTALLNGSVKISGKALKDPVYLKPDELFRYRKSDQTASVEEAKAGLYTDWIKDRLVFDQRLSG